MHDSHTIGFRQDEDGNIAYRSESDGSWQPVFEGQFSPVEIEAALSGFPESQACNAGDFAGFLRETLMMGEFMDGQMAISRSVTQDEQLGLFGAVGHPFWEASQARTFVIKYGAQLYRVMVDAVVRKKWGPELRRQAERLDLGNLLLQSKAILLWSPKNGMLAIRPVLCGGSRN